ncbi:hypothetical protein V6N13_098429 [Hibiscus sabdariffa]|uniref:C3H1-type domain-containing protein n=1 Tax=Hibiscus sabdariffa TaxID=183260 RepID=A0ABR2EFG4_9ROSI
MDSFYKKSNKLNVLNSNIPKVMIPARSRADYYSSPENLIKYLCSNSLSCSGNNSSSGKGSFRSSVSPQSEKKLVKVVEEDVLVMDGVLVASDTNIVGSGYSSSPGSVGFHKPEICKTWEEYGLCRYGSKCQFAHGKEEVRPSSCSFRSKSEARMYKSYASTYDSSLNRKTAAIIAQKESSIRPEYTSQRSSTPMKPENIPLTANIAMKPKTKKASTSTIRPDISITNGTYWSPQDDGIDVTLLSSPVKALSRGDTDAYIDSVLYGPATRRLPVFSSFCPR